MRKLIPAAFFIVLSSGLFSSCKKQDSAPQAGTLIPFMSGTLNTASWAASTISADSNNYGIGFYGTRASDGSRLEIAITSKLSAGTTYSLGDTLVAFITYLGPLGFSAADSGSISINTYSQEIVKGTFACRFNSPNIYVTKGEFGVRLK